MNYEDNEVMNLVNQNHERAKAMQMVRYNEPVDVVKVEKASENEYNEACLELLEYLKNNAKKILAGGIAVVTIAMAGQAVLKVADERTDKLTDTYDNARATVSQSYDAQLGEGAFDNLPFERQQNLIQNQLEQDENDEKKLG